MSIVAFLVPIEYNTINRDTILIYYYIGGN